MQFYSEILEKPFKSIRELKEAETAFRKSKEKECTAKAEVNAEDAKLAAMLAECNDAKAKANELRDIAEKKSVDAKEALEAAMKAYDLYFEKKDHYNREKSKKESATLFKDNDGTFSCTIEPGSLFFNTLLDLF